MKEARYFYVPNAAVETELPARKAVHAIRVLRLKGGDEMFLMGGEGCFYKAEVTLVSPKKCLYTIKETPKQESVWRGKIYLAIAPTKDMGRIEWMTEKATEVGFDEVGFLDCKFSEHRTLRADRIEKIVISTVKRSRKGWRPVANPMTPFRCFIENCSSNGRKFICHYYPGISRADLFTAISWEEQPSSAEGITVLVGPEGDFSIDEVRFALEHGFESVILSNDRLRTKTAGLSAVMMSQLIRRA